MSEVNQPTLSYTHLSYQRSSSECCRPLYCLHQTKQFSCFTVLSVTPRDRNTVETPDALDPAGGGLPTGSPCLRNYLVLARLFKLHPDFDAAVEGILVADADGCVVLIHETTDEEWTRAVWSRLRGALVQRGRHVLQLIESNPRAG